VSKYCRGFLRHAKFVAKLSHYVDIMVYSEISEIINDYSHYRDYHYFGITLEILSINL